MGFLKKFVEEKMAQENALEIDMLNNRYYFRRDKKLFDNREEAEQYLVSEYGVTPERAKRIINQGAVQGEINLDVVLER